MSYQVITDSAELAALLADKSASKLVAVDTEFMRRNTFFPQAALIQLCFDDDAQPILIDPLSCDELSPLKALFTNPDVVKVLHAPGEDLEVFAQLLGVQPQPMFDTQRAAAYLDMGFGLGYRALVELMTGVVVPKDETRSDWLQRPLTDAQLAYAAQDVVHLPDIYRRLRDDLIAKGALERLQEDCHWAVTEAGQTPAPGIGRIKSAWKLNPRQLALLQRICEWREDRARRSDKPRPWILSDNLCFQLAQQSPTTEAALSKLPDMPPAVVRKQGEVLLRLVAEVSDMDESDLPARLPSPLQPAQRDQLKKLKLAAREMAESWHMAPELILPSKDYELIVRLINNEDIERPGLWRGWRGREVVDVLLEQFRESSL